MSQLSLYMEDAVMEALRASAKASGQSLSGYVRTRLADNAGILRYPPTFFGLYGSLADVDFDLPDDPVPDAFEPLFA